jgi:hypothetical protein
MQQTKVVVCILFAITASISAQTPGASTAPNRPAQIFLTNDQLNPNENFQVIRAFISTGTLNQNCLATMGDTSDVAIGTIVFCAPRQPAGLGKGILISVFYPQPPSPGLTLSMTVMQEGARRYSAPVLCAVDGC